MRTLVLLVVIKRQRLIAGNYALVTVVDNPQRMRGIGFLLMAFRYPDMTMNQWKTQKCWRKCAVDKSSHYSGCWSPWKPCCWCWTATIWPDCRRRIYLLFHLHQTYRTVPFLRAWCLGREKLPSTPSLLSSISTQTIYSTGYATTAPVMHIMALVVAFSRLVITENMVLRPNHFFIAVGRKRVKWK